VVFFADPTVPHGGDVDLQALTRLAIVHDIPIALSPAAADMLATSLLTRGG
jgi:methylglyoxal synthase